MADAKAPNARVAKVATFMKENMASKLSRSKDSKRKKCDGPLRVRRERVHRDSFYSAQSCTGDNEVKSFYSVDMSVLMFENRVELGLERVSWSVSNLLLRAT